MDSANTILPSTISVTAASTSHDTRTYAERKLDEVTADIKALTAELKDLRGRRYDLLKKPKAERDESEQAELEDYANMMAKVEAMEKEKEVWLKERAVKVSSVSGMHPTSLTLYTK